MDLSCDVPVDTSRFSSSVGADASVAVAGPSAFSALIGLFRPQPSARFAAMFIGLTAGTVGFSAFLHFLDYRSFYAQYHSPTFKYWVGEQIMTGAGSVYIFMVQITPLLLPWGVVLLFAICAFHARATGQLRN